METDSVTNNSRTNYRAAVVALCISSLSNAVVIINLFPYSGYMVMYLLPDTTTPENVGGMAGILAASFMGGRFITAYFWGKVADTVGRVFVMQTSLVLSAVLSLLFGTSSSYSMAIFWRLCLGMSNAITSTSKTLASEIGYGDSNKEKQAMGLVIGMRSWGFLLGPAIGGIFADPIKQYPSMFQSAGWSERLFRSYPYLLPNIIVALFCLVGAIMVPLYIQETLERKNNHQHGQNNSEQQPLMIHKRDLETISLSDSSRPIWSRLSTRNYMIFNWTFSFIVTVIDDGFPLFCISTVGGLGYDEASIGQVLSLAGLFFALGQYFIYAIMVNRLGLDRSITVGCLLGLVPVVLIPLSVWFTRNGKSKMVVMTFLSLILGLTKIMICSCFASLAIVTNQSVPKTQRAKMNGLLLIGSSIGKGLGPLFAGFLVSLSFSGKLPLVPPEFGSAVIFGVVGSMGVLSTLHAMRLKTTRNNDTIDDDHLRPVNDVIPDFGALHRDMRTHVSSKDHDARINIT